MLKALLLPRTLKQTQTSLFQFSPFRIIASHYSSSSSSQKNSKEESTSKEGFSLINTDPTSPPRLFVVQPRLRPPEFLQAKLNEALCLANSLEEQREGYFETDFFEKELPPHVVVQNPALHSSKIRADTYFGPGTVKDIKIHLNAADSEDEEVDAVFVNAILSGVQQRNLERTWDKPVLDRVGLIIEIFNAHAHTKEAKLQAELAALLYKRSRLVRVRGLDGSRTFGAFGEAEVVSARGKGSGGRGFISGAGETELQLQRGRIIERRTHLLSQIEEVKRTRALQRASRRRRGGSDGQSLATVAVVGYTNAGKSTLISELSNTVLYSNARLFATLDPRLKSIVLPSGRKILLSDTVGFISDLPVQLVQAFQSTLEEVVEADLLVHVIDSTAPNLDEHRSTVLQVLQQIGVSEEKLQNMLEVWNKIDYEDEEIGDEEYINSGEDLSGAEDDEEETNQIESELSRNQSDDNEEEANQIKTELTQSQSDNDVEENGSVLSDVSSVNLDDESDGWLLSEDDQDEAQLIFSKTSDDNHTSSALQIINEVQSNGPHVKISALTGVGLQELLELIDERLNAQDKKLESKKVVSNSIYDRKWRPARTEDGDVALKQ